MNRKERSAHLVRALQTSHEAARWVRDLTDLDDVEQALTALEVVAGGIVRRLTYQEASDFIAQLPSELQEPLLELPAGPDRNLTIETVHAELVQRLGVEMEEAPKLAHAVGVALRRLVTPGELEDVLSQLPKEFWPLLPDEVAHVTP